MDNHEGVQGQMQVDSSGKQGKGNTQLGIMVCKCTKFSKVLFGASMMNGLEVMNCTIKVVIRAITLRTLLKGPKEARIWRMIR